MGERSEACSNSMDILIKPASLTRHLCVTSEALRFNGTVMTSASPSLPGSVGTAGAVPKPVRPEDIEASRFFGAVLKKRRRNKAKQKCRVF